jgi:hypothetical protein
MIFAVTNATYSTSPPGARNWLQISMSRSAVRSDCPWRHTPWCASLAGSFGAEADKSAWRLSRRQMTVHKRAITAPSIADAARGDRRSRRLLPRPSGGPSERLTSSVRAAVTSSTAAAAYNVLRPLRPHAIRRPGSRQPVCRDLGRRPGRGVRPVLVGSYINLNTGRYSSMANFHARLPAWEKKSISAAWRS